MSKVWRRLQRAGKKAAKYRFTSFSHLLSITCNSKWQPEKVCITWTHRGRKHSSRFSRWEPGLTNVYQGTVEWEKSTDQIEFDVTLYKGINDSEYEEKEWVLMVEGEDADGKRKILAQGKLNLEKYVSIDPFFQTEIENFNLKPASTKIKSASISFFIACQFIKDGKATDEDMISVASFMSSASSTTNPYLNSNYIFEHKYDDNNTTLKPGSSRLSNYSDNSEAYFVDEEDIGSYFKEQQLNPTLNNIAYNFNNGNYSDTLIDDTKYEEKIIIEPVIKKSNSSQNTTSTSPFKILSNSSSKLTMTSALNDYDCEKSNPFEETNKAVSENPFLDDDSKIDSNPFEDEIKSNPFLSDETTIELDSNSNIKTLGNLNNNKNLDQNNNTSKDLLDWCKDIIKCSKLLNHKLFNDILINDFSTSWSNGLAFCAIIHHFRPNLINLDALSETDSKANLKQAFNATDKELIVRVVDYVDLLNRKSVDQLSIMTYLYQIRERYDSSIQKNSIPKSKTLSSITKQISVNKNDNVKKTTTNGIKEVKKQAPKAPDNVMNQKTNTQKSAYFNPFDSDDDGANESKSKSKGIIEIRSDGKIVNAGNRSQSSKITDKKNSIEKKSRESSHKSKSLIPVRENTSSEELIERAKILFEKNKASQNCEKSEEIKQKAEQLIAESKANSMRKLSFDENKTEKLENVKNLEKLGNPFEESDELVGTEYINQEIINLKNKQTELDLRGQAIEKELRSIMKKTSANETNNICESEKKLEDKLLKDWFLLVNEKNSLLHQQQELEILQNEKSLERRYEILSDQLRALMSIDDFNKTDEQKRTESILFNELISLVNKRNDLVIQLDEENKLLNEEEYINEFIQNKSSFLPKEKQCTIQ